MSGASGGVPELAILTRDPLRFPKDRTLRLVGKEGEELVLDGPGGRVMVGVAALPAFVGPDYATARAALSEGSFVDVLRLLV